MRRYDPPERPALTLVGALLLALLPLPASSAVEPAESGDAVLLRGKVLDADGAPVEAATVSVLPSGVSAWQRHRDPDAWVDPVVVRSGEDGAFAAAGSAASSFSLRAQATGFAPFSATAIPAGAALTIRLERGRSLHGRVLDSPGGRPVAAARVMACDDGAHAFGRSACASTATDEDGRYLLEHLPRAGLELRASAPGRAASDLARVAADSADEVPALYLRPGAWLSGRVFDESGRPVPRARVLATDSLRRLDDGAPEREWPVFSDANGVFLLRGVESGSAVWIVAQRADRPAAVVGPRRVEAGGEGIEVEIPMPAAARLAMHLVDRAGAPVERVELVLHPAGSPATGARGHAVDPSRIDSLGAGRFEAGPLQPGRFDLHVLPAGFREIERRAIELLPGATTDLETLVVEPGRAVSGRVTDAAAAAIAAASVEASYSASGFDAVRTEQADESGFYRLAGLPDSPVTLIADAPGFVPSPPLAVAVERTTADFALEPAASVGGEVRFSDGGTPEAFDVVAHLEVAPDETGWFRPRAIERAFSGGGGSYVLDDLQPGRYTLEARAADHAPGRVTGVVLQGGVQAQAPPIELASGAALRGRVVIRPDETPLPAAHVEVRRRGGWIETEAAPSASEAVSDGAGRFEVRALPPGSYTVSARHPDFASCEIEVDVAEEAPDEVLLAVSRGGTLSGTVRDRDGRPAAGRTLIVETDVAQDSVARRAATDSDGAYAIERLGAGSYRAGLLPASGSAAPRVVWKTAVLRDGENTVLDFDDAARIRLSGTVRGERGPLPGVTLFFAPLRGGIDLSDFELAATDSAGRYEIALDAPGRYRVILDAAAGGGGGSTEIDVPDEPAVVRDIEPDRTGIAGTVSDEQGAPIAGASVTAESDAVPGLGALLVAESDAAGRYAIRGVSAGSYRVSAVAAGFHVAVRQAVEVAAERDMSTVDFRLERGAVLRGRVVDELGRGVAGAVVFAAPAGAGDSLAVASAETDIGGAFAMTAPADGAVDVAAFAAGLAPARADGVFPAEGPQDAGIVLHAGRGGRLRIRVVDESQRPRAAVGLSVRAVPGFPGSAFAELLSPLPPTDAGGTALAEHLAPGTYEIRLRDGSAPARHVVVEAGSETAIVIGPPG